MASTEEASGSGAPPGDEVQVTFNVKSSSDAKFVITVPASMTVLDLKNKLSTSEYADTPPERQRLIYSGRVLKDADQLSVYKIKDGNTVHLVKSAASNQRQTPATPTSPTSGLAPSNIAAGTGNNPLAGLTGARYAGFHQLPGMDMFGADGGMGAPPNPDQLLQMLENPMFLSQMNEAMQNPAVIQMMRDSPLMRNNPMARQMLDNPEMLRMMTNPEVIRAQLQLQRAMGGMGGGSNAFPAPGVTDTTPQGAQNPGQTNTGTQQQQQQPPNPFAMFANARGGAGANPAGAQAGNPFAALFGMPTQPTQASHTPATSPPVASAGQGTPANPSTPGTEAPRSTTTEGGATQNTENTQQQQTQQPPNPFSTLFGPGEGDQPNPIAEMTNQMMQNPEMMRNLMQMMGNQPGGMPGMGGMGAAGANPTGAAGAGAGAGTEQGAAGPNPWAALSQMMGAGGYGHPFGPGAGAMPQPPADTRPPEEVYAEQLRQLNDMGFYEFESNIRALRRSGGSVQGAVEYLLSGGGGAM